MSAAYGGQILISRTAYDSAPKGEFKMRDLGKEAFAERSDTAASHLSDHLGRFAD